MTLSKIITFIKYPILVFLLQFATVDILSIKGFRPDFIFILVLYTGVKRGSFYGVLVGFIIGLFSDLSGVGTYFGLSSLIYTLTGYISGYLKGRYSKLHPLVFHSSWVFLVAAIFFLIVFIRFHILFETDFPEFISVWVYTLSYTLGILGILQIVLPIKES